MADLHVNLVVLLGLFEFILILLVLAVILGVRNLRLARRLRVLERRADEPEPVAEPVSYQEYLRDELSRNQELIDRARANEDPAELMAAELLARRRQFLELELEARQLESNPVAFQGCIAAGMNELIEQLRPDAETLTDVRPAADETAARPEPSGEPQIRDTRDEQLDHLRQVINNQQDSMAVLRVKLSEHENELQGLDDILEKLGEFEKRSAELQRCLEVLEQENGRLKTAKQGGYSGGPGTAPEQLDGLKSMVGNQRQNIGKLQELIRELAPEAGKARELADAFAAMQGTNRELDGCVAVLQDENAMLRSELEQIQATIAQQVAAASQAEIPPAAEPVPGDSGELELPPDDAADSGLAEQNEQLETKVQELEALLEFKDAAIQELEKQYNALESKYRAATGQKKTGSSA